MNRRSSLIMSTIATSLVPTGSKPDSALQSARELVTHEISATTHYLAHKAHDLGLTPPSSKSTTTTTTQSRPNQPQVQPSTPTSSAPVYRESPGRFRHPRTTEIIKRSSAAALTDTNIKGALTNAAALILSFVLSDVYYSSIPPLLASTGVSSALEVSSNALLVLRLVLCANIILLLRPAIPYIAKKDQINDIPLTPSQRLLLGLDPSVPPSPASGGSYITPPRYRRASGSATGTPTPNSIGSDRQSISSSPLSTSRLGFSPSQSQRRSVSGAAAAAAATTTFSPSGSPLFHKAVSNQNPEFGVSARSSFGAGAGIGSGLSRSQSLRERPNARRESIESPASPTPTSGTRSPQFVPGLNYKWLYDKGMKLPKSESYGF
ncbi:hypothetical protein HRR83_004818 [Exophiala dermatitidis]|uniref:Uncharacterized protein n=2 Tax=Exophiala dermatitidis TaxID=5970 RepID=A0AAN6EZ73_EXODE|nr:hypothetical protein HRR74_003906 [Exophiala dermatitidis]KAJ4528981.1 hypothetical protein HRR73_000001 [Exophiala dermatitidis]KAJ4538373.1 hypothetical protein HRR77_006862 [Exophiala dermatitidis]KAJ4544385.1 hypothetical protein HRR76_002445 [Exophiala dermatitidis]KAJ4561800.1 hypothetical protein HRR79_007132 [Exophiala dermatitidis]